MSNKTEIKEEYLNYNQHHCNLSSVLFLFLITENVDQHTCKCSNVYAIFTKVHFRTKSDKKWLTTCLLSFFLWG